MLSVEMKAHAGRSWTPVGTMPSCTRRQSAINSLRARATISALPLQARSAFAADTIRRVRCPSAAIGTAKPVDHDAPDARVARAGQSFLSPFRPALVGRAGETGITARATIKLKSHKWIPDQRIRLNRELP